MPTMLSTTVQIANRRDTEGFLALRRMIGRLTKALATDASTTAWPANAACICP